MYRMTILLIALALLVSACNFDALEPTPTVEGVEDATPINIIGDAPTAEASPTPPATPTPPALALLGTPLPTWTMPPPTETATPTETPGPYVHRVQSGETLGQIVQRYGYFDPSIYREIVRINPNVPNENSLPVNAEIIIPRQTDTPTPPGFDITATANATRGIAIPQAISENTVIDCHSVRENETIISIAARYNTTIEILAQLNRDIPFRGCDFNNRSGGEGCNVLLNIGQCVRVPFPTATPTLSPTPSGSETPTPTPTYAPPEVISPPDGWTVRGSVELEWVSRRILQRDEFYYVEVRNSDGETVHRDLTRGTSLRLPFSLIPPSGEAQMFEWRLTLVRQDAQGNLTQIGPDRTRRFNWNNQ